MKRQERAAELEGVRHQDESAMGLAMTTCYMCSQEATSDEHVPPKCIFPERKDLPLHLDFRKDLITVPSCDEHNSEKSGDDEYLNMVILSHIENNLHAQRQFSKKQMRAFSKNPGKYRWLRNLFPIKVGGQDSGGFTVDRERVERSFDTIARGLHFHEYSEQWKDPIRVMLPSLIPSDSQGKLSPNLSEAHMFAITNRLLARKDWEGENPEVFAYKVHREIHPKGFVSVMVFFQGFQVATFAIPSVMRVADA